MDAIFEADEFERGHYVIAALLRCHFGQQQRQFDIFKRGQNRDEIESLKNVAHMRIAPLRGVSSFSLKIFLSMTSSSPEVGRSMAAIIFSKVVLPDPEGPISARNSPSA